MGKNSKDFKYIKVSLVINIIITLLTIIASVIMFSGFKFMKGEYVLESTRIGMFRFFTVDSNIFMGIIAFIFSIKEIKILKGEIDNIDKNMYILKLMATVGVALTFFTVFGYLGPISEGGIPSMIKNSNLFFHFIIPVLSVINFVIFERTSNLKFKTTFIGILPTLLYAIYYITNILIHMEEGKISPKYDWYWFAQGGIIQIVIVMPLMLGISYIISLLLWQLNKKREKI